MIYFRVDANVEIATGHAMRCLSVASAAKEKNIDSTFIVSDEWGKELIERKGYPVHCLQSDWNDKEGELPALCTYLKKQEAKLLIVDSYQVTDDYIQELRKWVKVIYVDDVDLLRSEVDGLLNYNNYGATEEYKCRYREHVGKDTKLLLGCEYAPLRDEFAKIIPRFSEQAEEIFISTGGADKYHIALQIVEELLKRNMRTVMHVIVGSFHPDKEKLKEIAEGNSACVVHENVTNMSEIMTRCDLAISAGGSTTYEVCACGLPMIVFSFADNQLEIVKTHHKQGTAIYAGDYREEKEKLITRIGDMVFELTKDPQKRRILHENSKALVDKKGASRIVEKLAEYYL